jgi:D-glycero-D-manno-heptose 1,7-bisphosphate phosphatase
MDNKKILEGRGMRDWPKKVVPRYQHAIFLDRDGTINADLLENAPGAIEGIKMLSMLPLHIIVVSNQAGIALGVFTREQMSEFNAELRSRVESAGGRIDAFYFCPHHEPKHLSTGTPLCSCSKPRPGMLLEAAEDFGLDTLTLFSVSLEVQSDLDSSHISDGLLREFEDKGISLSAKATVSVEEKGNRWLIIDDPIDDPTVYPVRKEDGELSIYHLSNSFIIGDKTSDIAAGEKVGCIGIRVKVAKKGEGGGEGKPVPIETKHFVKRLDDAALIIQSYLEQESYHKQISIKL